MWHPGENGGIETIRRSSFRTRAVAVRDDAQHHVRADRPPASLAATFGASRLGGCSTRALGRQVDNMAMTSRQALAFIRKHGVVLEAAQGPVPSLVEVIAGEPVRSSWWSHP